MREKLKIKGNRRVILIAGSVIMAATLLGVAAFLAIALYGRKPLPALEHLSRTAANLSDLPRTEVCWVETGHAFGSGSFSMTASGLLIRHPGGDVLIDGGNSSRFEEEVSQFPLWQRLVMIAIPGRLKPRVPLSEALRALGETPGKIQLLIPSHAHLDHVGGYEDLPRIPVLLSPLELSYLYDHDALQTGAVIPQQAKMLQDGRARELKFSETPYEIYQQSFDLYKDGSIVLVPLPGHTPGSVGIFVNLDADHRVFYVGDAALQVREITERIRKPFFIQDVEPEKAAEVVQQLNELHRMLPTLAMIPAHGRSGFFSVFPDGPGTCRSSMGSLK
jgi:glyoxylase-like metal-dependent hydrolase (beta-lactamase superfamily II)